MKLFRIIHNHGDGGGKYEISWWCILNLFWNPLRDAIGEMPLWLGWSWATSGQEANHSRLCATQHSLNKPGPKESPFQALLSLWKAEILKGGIFDIKRSHWLWLTVIIRRKAPHDLHRRHDRRPSRKWEQSLPPVGPNVMEGSGRWQWPKANLDFNNHFGRNSVFKNNLFKMYAKIILKSISFY